MWGLFNKKKSPPCDGGIVLRHSLVEALASNPKTTDVQDVMQAGKLAMAAEIKATMEMFGSIRPGLALTLVWLTLALTTQLYFNGEQRNQSDRIFAPSLAL